MSKGSNSFVHYFNVCLLILFAHYLQSSCRACLLIIVACKGVPVIVSTAHAISEEGGGIWFHIANLGTSLNRESALGTGTREQIAS
jgi:hypothetical protein